MREPNRGKRIEGSKLLSAYYGKMLTMQSATLLVHKGHAFLATQEGFFDLGTDHSVFKYDIKMGDALEFEATPVNFEKDYAVDGKLIGADYKGEHWIVLNPDPKDKSLNALTRPPILISYIKAS